MSKTAVKTLSQLKKIIMKQFDDKAGKLIGVTNSYASKVGVLSSTFKPDDSGFNFLDVSKDWYLAGNAKCSMIEGMETIKETPEEKKAMDNAVLRIDESKIRFLANVNTADEEKIVATTGGVSFRDTVSHLSYDREMSVSKGHTSGEERTVVMEKGYCDVPLTHLKPLPLPKAKQDALKPEVPDENMTNVSGKNGMDGDGMGGSSTRSINDKET